MERPVAVREVEERVADFRQWVQNERKIVHTPPVQYQQFRPTTAQQKALGA